VPSLSCEPGIHCGGRDLNQRVDRARREEIPFWMVRKIIKQTKFKEEK